jgi:hypothetical protein
MIDSQIRRRIDFNPEFRERLIFGNILSYLGKTRTGQNRREGTEHKQV